MLGSLILGWTITRTVRALRLPTPAIVLMIVALPFAIQSSYPLMAHVVEAILLGHAIAEHAGGRRHFALALAAAACFAKPAMGYVYGFLLTFLITRDLYRSGALKPRRRDGIAITRAFAPARVTSLALAGIAIIANGSSSLVATVLPISGLKHYALFDYGFFRGRGKYFWYGMPPVYFLGSVVAFWFAASAYLIVAALRALPRMWRAQPEAIEALRDEIVVAMAVMHVLFVTLFFAGPSSWISYSYLLVIGAVVASASAKRNTLVAFALMLFAATGQTARDGRY